MKNLMNLYFKFKFYLFCRRLQLSWAGTASIKHDRIRLQDGFCPITAVVWSMTGEYFPLNLSFDANKYLGFTENQRLKIIRAADFSPNLSSEELLLRKKMMRSLGLF